MEKISITKKWLNINGADRMVVYNKDDDTLATVLRRIGLTGTKVGCGTGVCGSCSVILDGKVVRSCTRKLDKINEYAVIETIEGIGTPNNPHPLQKAFIHYGAIQCGFCSPGFIVSAKALLDTNKNPSREDVRDWFQKHRNICRCTGYKQIVDAVMGASKVMRGESTFEDLEYKISPDKKIYGTAVHRPTGMAKACGTLDYGDDLKYKMPSDTLHLAVVQPKITHHAKIISIDTQKAMSMPGVKKVITAKDVQGTNRVNIFPTHPRAKILQPVRPIIADEKIFRYGDVVAVVAADTEKHAREAAKEVTINYEQLPEYLDLLDAVAPNAVRVHNESPNIYMLQPRIEGEEKANEVIDKSSNSVSGSFYSTREPHLSIEGDAVQAYWDEDGMLTIQCKSQGLMSARMQMAKGIGIDIDNLRIIENPTGGSFGWATNAGSYALAGVCAMALGVPVTMSFSYEEFIHYTGKRCPAYSNARLACDDSGKITALEYDIALDHGAYTEMSDALIHKIVRYMGYSYNIPTITGLARMVYTNNSFGITYRGFGSPQCYTVVESLVDMLADKIGMDPFDFRYANIAKPGDKMPSGILYKDYPFKEIMDKMRPYYDDAVARAKKEDTPKKRRGVGVSFGGFNCGSGPVDRAEVALSINPDGTFTHWNTWEEQGQGGDVGPIMHVCEELKELGVTPDMVKVIQNDTKYCPDTGMAAGSRSHCMTGTSTNHAAKQLLDAMRKDDGTYRTYEEMVNENIPTKYLGVTEIAGTGLTNIDPNTGVGDPNHLYNYGMFLVETEVDTETGKTKVLSMMTVCDVGVIGNIASVDGQAFGGMSHSIGFALQENYSGEKKYSNMAACGVPTILDIPDDMQAIYLENPRENGPHGSAGCSEFFQSGGHVAVLNAIYNATGVRITELPAEPSKIMAGLEAIKNGEYSPSEKYYLGSDMYEEIEEIEANPV